MKSLALPASRGKPGRKPSTTDIAQFANERRPKLTWKEISTLIGKDSIRTTRELATMTSENIREAWRRYYGKKMSVAAKLGASFAAKRGPQIRCKKVRVPAEGLVFACALRDRKGH